MTPQHIALPYTLSVTKFLEHIKLSVSVNDQEFLEDFKIESHRIYSKHLNEAQYLFTQFVHFKIPISGIIHPPFPIPSVSYTINPVQIIKNLHNYRRPKVRNQYVLTFLLFETTLRLQLQHHQDPLFSNENTQNPEFYYFIQICYVIYLMSLLPPTLFHTLITDISENNVSQNDKVKILNQILYAKVSPAIYQPKIFITNYYFLNRLKQEISISTPSRSYYFEFIEHQIYSFPHNIVEKPILATLASILIESLTFLPLDNHLFLNYNHLVYYIYSCIPYLKCFTRMDYEPQVKLPYEYHPFPFVTPDFIHFPDILTCCQLTSLFAHFRPFYYNTTPPSVIRLNPNRLKRTNRNETPCSLTTKHDHSPSN